MTWTPTPPTAAPTLLARLDEPVTEPAAYVLPLHRRDDDSGWASADWRLRRGRIVLLEGDSPAGLRLPLDSDQLAAAAPTSHPADPLARRGGLPARCGTPTPTVEDDDPHPPRRWSPRSGDGLLYVFLPPTEELEHFVDLVAG